MNESGGNNFYALMLQCCVCLSSSVRNVMWLNGAS